MANPAPVFTAQLTYGIPGMTYQSTVVVNPTTNGDKVTQYEFNLPHGASPLVLDAEGVDIVHCKALAFNATVLNANGQANPVVTVKFVGAGVGHADVVYYLYIGGTDNPLVTGLLLIPVITSVGITPFSYSPTAIEVYPDTVADCYLTGLKVVSYP